MMREGERQVSETLAGIRRDHLARYEWAAGRIPAGAKVIDFACGIGYGARIVAEAGGKVRAYDVAQEALDYAAEHYAHPQVEYRQRDGRDPGDLPAADVAICFETVEHIDDPRPLLRALRAAAPRLLASVPNEGVLPYNGQAYHFRHYTRAEFQALLNECGWQVKDWHGQDDDQSDVADGGFGRTLIAVCERGPIKVAADPMGEQAKPGIVPKHVAILGLGPSINQYLELAKRLGGRRRYCDETWGINALGDVFACDRIFHMDDVRIQEIRAKAKPESNIAAMLDWLKTTETPVITSRAHPDYPALVEFPLEAVLNDLGHDYFNSTAAYAVAYAIHIGVEKISVFGNDFTYPNAHHAEKGRACVEFWLGFARARGIRIMLPKTTSLMDAMHSRESRLYGYDTVDVRFGSGEGGRLKLGFTERDRLPGADEIEANYNHAAPVAEQHLSTKEAS